MPPIEMTIDPIIAQLGPIELGWHGLFTALAVMAGLWVGLRCAGQLGLDTETIASAMGWVLLGAVVGARLFHVLDHLEDYARRPQDIIAVWQGGIAVYGGFIGGILAGVVAARRYRVPIWPALDAAAPGMLVGQAIGRIGCFINGDAWGAPTSCTWCGAVVYWHPRDLIPANLIGVPTYPYPLYEIGADLLLLGLLWLLRSRLRGDGTTFLAAAIGYAVIRFALTAFRQEAVIALGLQEAQVIALVTGLIAAAILLVRTRRARPAAVPAP
ncbi:MAG: prolipoprotein diacylglyceryl transferase [Chloroflexi bacterium]|nr:prolipoprotein diacylglyceryl transferase [Chloroflexota bacterium]